jgi:16S rRNA processing protein RimM
MLQKKAKLSNNLLLVGKITGSHGIRGEVKLQSYTQDPKAIFDYTSLCIRDGSSLTITFSGTVKEQFIASIENIADRNQAEILKNTSLFIQKSELPALPTEEHYHEELIGLTVINPEGKTIGAVSSVQNFGAGDLLEITFNNGTSEYFPYHHDFFPEEDDEKRTITLAEVKYV